jgi:hypothetical protein
VVAESLRALEERRGVAVLVKDVRRKAGLPKERFDSAAFRLTREGTVVLHEHDAPSLMTETARDELVADSKGRYYVGISWTHSG